MKPTLLIWIIILVLSLNFAAAAIVDTEYVSDLEPGQEGQILLEVYNDFDEDMENAALSLNFAGLPLSPVGSSAQSEDQIRDGRTNKFSFKVRASSSAKPGDYEIPYVLSYQLENDKAINKVSGTIGLRITGDPELSYTVTAEKAVVNAPTQVKFKIVNKGYAEAKFVAVTIVPEGLTLLSDREVYLGTVESDDFETANFEVIYGASGEQFFRAVVTYRNFENQEETKNVILPVTVYSPEEALALGIIKSSSLGKYFLGALMLVVGFIVWKAVRKHQRRKRLRKKETLEKEK
ncbi:MAG TPA: hypothetical protein VJC39_04560 [Candidatus Nanoarchaeia archaeon]|nr:hypothetical protein [Candidatus Nanoarchaeia archaeon]